MNEPAECNCSPQLPHFHEGHRLSCPVYVKFLKKVGDMELWIDESHCSPYKAYPRRCDLVLVKKNKVLGNVHWDEMFPAGAAFDMPHLSSDMRHVSTRNSSGMRWKCKCRNSIRSCPGHTWYEFPIHEKCWGDGCEECNYYGYTKKPLKWSVENGFAKETDIIPLEGNGRNERRYEEGGQGRPAGLAKSQER